MNVPDVDREERDALLHVVMCAQQVLIAWERVPNNRGGSFVGFELLRLNLLALRVAVADHGAINARKLAAVAP